MKSWDIIVIGSGISGLNFALRAAEKWQRVLIITKKKVAQSSTNFAQGGIAAVLSKLDDFKKHVKDTLVAGCFHNNVRAVEYMVRHGPSAITRLIELGVPFATHNGELLLTREGAPSGRANNLASLRLGLEGGHHERRIAFVSDYTGQAIETVLVEKVRKNPHITLMEHTFAVDLLVKNRCCYGVQILNSDRCENKYAKTVILATGGIGQIYGHTTNPSISTGDGIAMAARAGCRFRDLEFVQFHPTAFSRKGKCSFLVSEAVRGEGAYLRNSAGERFMKKIHRLAELAPRDIVSRAIFEQEKNGPVYLDLRHKDAKKIEMRFPQIYQKLKSYGIDMARDLIPISPAAHYLCGGIRVNLRGETGIKNLYAFGEVAGTGVQGANRLASNSLLEALVFSDRIVKEKRLRVKGRGLRVKNFMIKNRKLQLMSKKEKYLCRILRKRLKQMMWQYVGIVRSVAGLLQAQKVLEKLLQEAEKIRGAEPDTLELKNMLTAAQLITKAALKRQKSLGCHYIAFSSAPHTRSVAS
ncbi:L-aspartate oxidase [Candidatus Peregrinibacteria bacterium]|nr:L-aspartate oxidase [Candidatus Peregrinibacteria bacterium]